MSDPKVRVRARVTVTLLIDVSDAWGGDCPVSEVDQQARESAVYVLRQIVRKANGAAASIDDSAWLFGRDRVEIVSVPKVEAVSTVQER